MKTPETIFPEHQKPLYALDLTREQTLRMVSHLRAFFDVMALLEAQMAQVVGRQFPPLHLLVKAQRQLIQLVRQLSWERRKEKCPSKSHASSCVYEDVQNACQVLLMP